MQCDEALSCSGKELIMKYYQCGFPKHCTYSPPPLPTHPLEAHPLSTHLLEAHPPSPHPQALSVNKSITCSYSDCRSDSRKPWIPINVVDVFSYIQLLIKCRSLPIQISIHGNSTNSFPCKYYQSTYGKHILKNNLSK